MQKEYYQILIDKLFGKYYKKEEVIDNNDIVVCDEILEGFNKEDYVYIVENYNGIYVYDDISKLLYDCIEEGKTQNLLLQGKVKNLLKSKSLNDIKSNVRIQQEKVRKKAM